MTEDKPRWEFNRLHSAFYQMFLCSQLMSSTRLAALSTSWGKNNLQITTICRKECWWGAESKNVERRDVMAPAPWVVRSRERQTVSKHSPRQGTEWKWWARPLGKDNPGRYPQAWGYGHGGGGVFGNIEKGSLCPGVWAPNCPLLGFHTGIAGDCPGGCIASSASPVSRGEADKLGQ